MAHDEALAERFVAGHEQAVAQLGEAGENKTHAVLGVHGEVADAGLRGHRCAGGVPRRRRGVDEEDGQLSGLLREVGDFDSDGMIGRGAGALDAEAESPDDGRVHVEHVAGGQGDVVHAIQAGMELCGEVSAHGVDGAPVTAENAIGPPVWGPFFYIH